MKKIELLVIHCSATPEDRDVKAATIKGWHMDPKPRGRGWSKPGYAAVIELYGNLEILMHQDTDPWLEANEITYGAKGYNQVARHICYVGGTDQSGKPKDTRTMSQKETMEVYVKNFLLHYPDAKIAGHNQLSTKACPSFDVCAWCKEIGVKDKNIYTS